MKGDGSEPSATLLLLFGVLLTFAYTLFAYIGLEWAMVAGAGSPVWPAAGVGLAGLLLGGLRLWPAIFIGRMLAGWLSGSEQAVWVELMLGGANAVGTWVPVYIIHRLGGIDTRLRSLKDVGRFLVAGTGLGALISATLGAATLTLANSLAQLAAFQLWLSWLVGNFAGGMTTGALILAWSHRRRPLSAQQKLHFAALMVAALMLSWQLFTSGPTGALRTWHLLPVLVWAALAFEVRGAAAILVLISMMAIWATNNGLGPFAAAEEAPIPLIQQFISVTAVTILLLATIVDERRAGEATRQREERLRAAISASGAGTFHWQFESDLLNCDADLLALLGVAEGQPPRRMEDLVGLFHPKDRALALTAFDACVRRGQDFALVARIGRENGPFRIIQGRGRRVDDVDGLPDYVTGAFVDITERNKLEQRLLEAEETYRAVFEQAGVGVARLAMDGTIVEVNERFCNIAGRPLRDLLGSNWHALTYFEPQSPPTDLQIHAEAASDSRVEKRYHRPAQRPVWVDESLTLVRNERGTPAFYVAVVQDITERKQAEEDERLRAEELEVVLRAVPAAIWFAHDSACTEVTGNSFSREILRLPDVSVNMSKSAADPAMVAHFKVFDHEGIELAPPDLPVQRAARGEIIRNFEERIIFADGSSVYLLGNASPLLDASGNVRGSVAAFIDITDRKRAEAREHLLSREVDHRAKNVLAVVQAIVQLTQADNMPAFRRLVAGRIQSLARTHTLLAESRWEGVDLHRLVIDELAPIALNEAGQIDAVHFHVDGPAVWLKPSAAQALAIVVHELVTNAIKYGGLTTPDGHVRVEWHIGGSADQRQLELRWEEHGRAEPEAGAPSERGFGWTVIRTSVEDQLGGSLTPDWAPTGLKLRIDIPLDQLGEISASE